MSDDEVKDGPRSLAAALGDSAAERVQSLLAYRNELIRSQVAATEGLADEVGELREALSARPTRAEINRTRRKLFARQLAILVVIMLVTAYGAIYAHEQYREQCRTGPLLAGTTAPGWCPYVFPGHTSDVDPLQLPPSFMH